MYGNAAIFCLAKNGFHVAQQYHAGKLSQRIAENIVLVENFFTESTYIRERWQSNEKLYICNIRILCILVASEGTQVKRKTYALYQNIKKLDLSSEAGRGAYQFTLDELISNLIFFLAD